MAHIQGAAKTGLLAILLQKVICQIFPQAAQWRVQGVPYNDEFIANLLLSLTVKEFWKYGTASGKVSGNSTVTPFDSQSPVTRFCAILYI